VTTPLHDSSVVALSAVAAMVWKPRASFRHAADVANPTDTSGVATATLP
jgi:hypothetical protein